MKLLTACILMTLTFTALADDVQKPTNAFIEKLMKDTAEWLKMTDQEKINFVQEKIKMQLKDPNSAQFKNVFVSSAKNVCGEMNAKNSYGGYNGFSLFYYSRLEDKTDINTHKEYFDAMCKQ